MATLGSLGAPHDTPAEPDNPDTFDWFGTEIRVVGEVNEVELIDFMAEIRDIDEKGLAGLAALRDAFTMLVHPDDFRSFWQIAKRERQTTRDLAAVFQAVMEGIGGRPTQQSSDSSDGLPSIPVSSQVVSSSVVSSGRPDLQLLQDNAAEQNARLAGAMAG